MQGTLDLLILKALSLAPMHGWGITGRIKQLSRESFRAGQGSLYPALHRYEQRGWVNSYWRTTEHNRVARYYDRSEEHTSELQSQSNLVCRLLLEKKSDASKTALFPTSIRRRP